MEKEKNTNQAKPEGQILNNPRKLRGYRYRRRHDAEDGPNTVTTHTIIYIVLCALLMLVFIFVISDYASSAETYDGTLETLKEEQKIVERLTASSAGLGTAITVLPGDIATPVAEKLVDMSGYFFVAYSAIVLEKYLLPILGLVSYRFLIPLALFLYIVYLIRRNPSIRGVAAKLVLFAVALSLVIPVSVGLSDFIQETYQDSTIEQTIQDAQDTQDALQLSDDENILKSLGKSISGKAKDLLKQAETALNNLIEAAAIMIVTTCLIPILVIVFFLWLIKLLLGINIDIPRVRPHQLMGMRRKR